MEREEQIKKLREKFDLELSSVTNLKDLNELRVSYLGKKSDLVELSKLLGSMDETNRRQMGALLNETRTYINDKLESLSLAHITWNWRGSCISSK
jgi:phenylalanyl-tRNA synthetase alpha chain